MHGQPGDAAGLRIRRSSISQAVSKLSIWVNTENAVTRSTLSLGNGSEGSELFWKTVSQAAVRMTQST